MLEQLDQYFLQPSTIDRFRRSWLAGPIERYVTWLSERRFAARTIARRVPLLIRFGEYARLRGVSDVGVLARHIDGFVKRELRRRARPCRSRQARQTFISDLTHPIKQMLRVVVPAAKPAGKHVPFARWAPGFFVSLREERGLSDATIAWYRIYLTRFETHADSLGIKKPDHLTLAVFDSFIARTRRRLCVASLGPVCSALRALLRYMFRQGLMRRDLGSAVERPRAYRLSGIPRAVQWSEVLRTLDSIDRRSALGRRDYAILLLLAVYGLRAREVATLTLDDIDWGADIVRIRGRKAGNASSYPLASQVGEALVDYLRNGRPATSDRRLFMGFRAPRGPIDARIVAARASHHLKAAGVVAPRLGSHTLRQSVAQHLVESDFSLKVVGDYLGHRCAASTMIYSKVSLEALRELALGDGESLL